MISFFLFNRILSLSLSLSLFPSLPLFFFPHSFYISLSHTLSLYLFFPHSFYITLPPSFISNSLYLSLWKKHLSSGFLKLEEKNCTTNEKVSISSTLYSRLLHQYFCDKKLQSQNVSRNELSYEKFSCKMLMKLTAGRRNSVESIILFMHCVSQISLHFGES